jgi:hypothetical protein
LDSPIPQISAMPALPSAFAHSHTLRQPGVWPFSRHSNDTTRMISSTRINSSAR